MKTTDKFLVGIVLGIGLLVAAAFGVALLRPGPAYQSDDTPEGVTHNYLLALRQADYARAYGYLSPALDGYPASAEAFAEDIEDHGWNFRLQDQSVSLEVGSSRTVGVRVLVSVHETTFYQNGLFDSGQSESTFGVTLEREAPGGAWKVVESDSYWIWCWGQPAGCQ